MTGLRRFVIRWEVPWYLATVALYGAAVIIVIAAFPGVSNLWVAIFVLIGGFTSSVGAAISAIKTREPETPTTTDRPPTLAEAAAQLAAARRERWTDG